MDDLVLRGVITDKGKEGKESFFIIDSPSEVEGRNNIVNRDSEHENSFNALHDFIDEKFYSVLINKIKTEIKLALNDGLSHDTIKSIKQTNNNKNENKCFDELIATLKDEIKFLRNELNSKDKILSNDILNERAGKNVNDFVVKSSGSNAESKDVSK